MRIPFRLAVVVLFVAACNPAVPATGGPTRVPAAAEPTGGAVTPSAAPLPTAGLEYDLSRLDEFVRRNHAGPFTIHPESEWVAKLYEVRPKLALAKNQDEVFVLFSRLGGLLDRHSFVIPKSGFHGYPILFYRFSDGWFVVAARDEALIGSALVSIGGHPLADVEAAMRPLVGFDNETGALDAVVWTFPFVEYLHGSGVVIDPATPAFGLRLPDGTTRTVDLPIVGEAAWVAELNAVGTLVGDATEAVARREEQAWYRIDKKRRTFLLSINGYDTTKAIDDALIKALDEDVVDRVVLDIRYLRGGSGLLPVIELLKDEPRINRPGGLVVLIGRENESIATAIVRDLDINSEAILMGEPTPARADNFRCECRELQLDTAEIIVVVPTVGGNTGDDRPAVPPDVPMSLSSTDFFAGRDPILEAALAGELQR